MAEQGLPPTPLGVIKAGPWGGQGGDPFDLGDNTGDLLAIRIRYGGAVGAISFKYDKDGSHEWTPRLGNGGDHEYEISLPPGEYLSFISGYCGSHKNTTVVTSLTFGTDKGQKYGPYGKQGGTAFSIPVINAKIISFFGRSGDLLDAIGVYVKQA